MIHHCKPINVLAVINMSIPYVLPCMHIQYQSHKLHLMSKIIIIEQFLSICWSTDYYRLHDSSVVISQLVKHPRGGRAWDEANQWQLSHNQLNLPTGYACSLSTSAVRMRVKSLKCLREKSAIFDPLSSIVRLQGCDVTDTNLAHARRGLTKDCIPCLTSWVQPRARFPLY